MFRIKNVRNSTVAKQNNISPSINRNTPIASIPVPKVLPNTKKVNQVGEGNRNNHRINHQRLKGLQIKLKVPQNHHKVFLVSKAHLDNLGQVHNQQFNPEKTANKQNQVAKEGKSFEKQNNLIKNSEQNTFKTQKSPQQKICQRQHINKQQGETNTILNVPMETIQNSAIQQQKLEQFIKKEEQANKNNIENQALQKQQQIQRHQRQQRLRLERQQKRERDQQEQKQNQKKLKQMTQKIHARRKARQQHRVRQRNLQEALQKQRCDAQLSSNLLPGGIVTLNDPLAHIQMSQALMDLQISKLLNMKFAGYPNKQAIQQQIEELDRINQSYNIVRLDPTNSLIRGLANFRVQLFNRVGQLVMAGQAQMGPSASGLQVYQVDHINQGIDLIKGAKVTRGLQGHIKNILKMLILQSEQQCAICLGIMEANEQIYEVKCGHLFHKQCLQQWLVNTANCPACRYNIKFDHP